MSVEWWPYPLKNRVRLLKLKIRAFKQCDSYNVLVRPRTVQATKFVSYINPASEYHCVGQSCNVISITCCKFCFQLYHGLIFVLTKLYEMHFSVGGFCYRRVLITVPAFHRKVITICSVDSAVVWGHEILWSKCIEVTSLEHTNWNLTWGKVYSVWFCVVKTMVLSLVSCAEGYTCFGSWTKTLWTDVLRPSIV